MYQHITSQRRSASIESAGRAAFPLLVLVAFLVATSDAQTLRYHAQFVLAHDPNCTTPSCDHNAGGIAINECGQVLGGSNFPEADSVFVWDPHAGFRFLFDENGSSDGIGAAEGINERGDVAGSTALGACVWDAAGDVYHLPVVDSGYGGRAYDINNRGEVVGSGGWGGLRGMMYWSAETGMIHIDDMLGVCWCSALYEINDSGVACGYATSFRGDEAVLWTLAGGLVSIRDDNAAVIAYEAVAINELGQVTGDGASYTLGSEGFFWDPATGVQGLGFIDPPDPLAWHINWPADINDLGQVVGESFTYHRMRGPRARAFIWDAQNGIRDLTLLADRWTLQQPYQHEPGFWGAMAINNRGQIIVQSWATELIILHPFLLADMNCDGGVDLFDIDGFLLALFDLTAFPAAYPDCRHEGWAADLNQDAAVNFFDIDPFVDCLLGVCP